MYKTYFLFLLTLFACHHAVAQQHTAHKRPHNLEEAIVQLDMLLADSTKTKIRGMAEEKFLENAHFGLGMAIRNRWGLWRGKELAKYFRQVGVFNPEDMSAIVLQAYYRHLNGHESNLNDLVAELNSLYQQMQDTAWQRQRIERYWSEQLAPFHIGDTLTRRHYYDRNWLGTPRKNTLITAVVREKSARQLHVAIISTVPAATEIVHEELNFTAGEGWISPESWRIYRKVLSK